ncbi:MAG: alpha/beta hydrolase [Burkholderiales bacterium]
MPNRSPLPADIDSLDQVHALDAVARRHVIEAPAGPMVWRSWGEGDPLVLFHGGSGSWTHWVRNIGPLASAGRQVWVPDLPGFGESASVGRDADALPVPMERALAELLGDQPVDVAGFSFGTMVGAFIAAQFPQRVRRLVFTGAPALGVRSAHPIDLQPWAHLPPGPELEAAMRENLRILMLSDPAAIDPLAVALHTANLQRDRMKRRRISRTEIMKETLPSLRCPVYGIWGEDDVLHRGVQDQLPGALARAPGFVSLVLIPHAGHWAPYERPQAYNAALLAALAG